MKTTLNFFLSAIAMCALQVVAAGHAWADESTTWWNPPKQQGEDRWVPSAAILMGFIAQNQSGYANSVIFENNLPPAMELGGEFSGDSTAIAPFVGFDFQIMAPSISSLLRQRFFFGAEILPTFAQTRDLAVQGNPGCIRGPEPGAPCASDEDGSRRYAYGQAAANGEGTRTDATINTLVYGLSLGTSVPLEVYNRPLRLKVMAAFLSYRVDASGQVVYAACNPTNICTDYTPNLGQPPVQGFLRDTDLTADRARRYYTLGPGFDLEMDAGRFGPMGASIFTGMRAYKVFGDRTIPMSAVESFDDPVGLDTEAAAFEVTVNPWLYRAHVGIRFQWLGDKKD